MIWKSQQSDSTIEIAIAADALREAFRVVPDADDPVIIQIEGRLARVLNISAGGFSCRCREIETGMRYRIRVNLPDIGFVIAGFADVVEKEGEVFHCRFAELSAEHSEWIHNYVWQRQKQAVKLAQELKRA